MLAQTLCADTDLVCCAACTLCAVLPAPCVLCRLHLASNLSLIVHSYGMHA
jgi:hypothetical protein